MDRFFIISRITYSVLILDPREGIPLRYCKLAVAILLITPAFIRLIWEFLQLRYLKYLFR